MNLPREFSEGLWQRTGGCFRPGWVTLAVDFISLGNFHWELFIWTVVRSLSLSLSLSLSSPQWGAADAEIKVPSGENTEIKRSPFKVWSRSVYSHTCYAYCQEFLPRLFLPFRSIHLHFFQNLSQFFPVLAAASTGSYVGPQNKIGHSVECRSPYWVPAEYKLAKNMTYGMMTSEMNDLDIEWSLCSALM